MYKLKQECRFSLKERPGQRYSLDASTINIRKIKRHQERSLGVAYHKQYRSKRLLTLKGGIRAFPSEGISIEKGLAIIGKNALSSPPLSPSAQRRYNGATDRMLKSTNSDYKRWKSFSLNIPEKLFYTGYREGKFVSQLEQRRRVVQADNEARLNKEFHADYEMAIRNSIISYWLTDLSACRRLKLRGIYRYSTPVIKGPMPWRHSLNMARNNMEAIFVAPNVAISLNKQPSFSPITPFSNIFFNSVNDTSSMFSACEFENNVCQLINDAKGELEKELQTRKPNTAPSNYIKSKVSGLRIQTKLVIDQMSELYVKLISQHCKHCDVGPLIEIEVSPRSSLRAELVTVKLKLKQIPLTFEILYSAFKLGEHGSTGLNDRQGAKTIEECLVSIVLPQRVQRLTKQLKQLASEKKMDQVDEFVLSNFSYDGLEAYMNELNKSCNDLFAMQTRLIYPLVCFNMQILWQKALDSVERCQKRLASHATELSRSINDKAATRFHGVINRIMIIPKSIDDYMNLIMDISQAKSVDYEALVQDSRAAWSRWKPLFHSLQVETRELFAFKMILDIPNRLDGAFELMIQQIEGRRLELEKEIAKKQRSVVQKIENVVKCIKYFGQYTAIDNMLLDRDIGRLKRVNEMLNSVIEEIDILASYQKIMELKVFQYELSQLKLEFDECFSLWSLVFDVYTKKSKWMTQKLKDLDVDDVQLSVAQWSKNIDDVRERTGNTENNSAILDDLEDRVGVIKDSRLIINAVCNPGMRERHWKTLSTTLNTESDLTEESNLQELLDFGIVRFSSKVEEISSAALNEYTMETSLENIKSAWSTTTIQSSRYRETRMCLLKYDDMLQIQLDNHLVKLRAMIISPFVGSLQKEVQTLAEKLKLFKDVMDAWFKCQSTWAYLEPIFASNDIALQIPDESGKFNQVNAYWIVLCDDATKTQRALEMIEIPEIQHRLHLCLELLDVVQIGFRRYLEIKRRYFPRFYFLSNDELLEILAETRDPTKVQRHLPKCFEGINSLQFNEKRHIIGIVSREGENVTLVRPIIPSLAKGQVEKWLLEIEDVMIRTVKHNIIECIKVYDQSPVTEWISKFPAQVVLAVCRLFWTTNVEAAIKLKESLEKLLTNQDGLIKTLTHFVSNANDPLLRQTVMSLLTIEVQGRDAIEEMVRQNVTSVTDFLWISQARYYWENERLLVRMMNIEQEYGNEYLGNSPRLVATPLTLRCQRSILLARQFNLGGAPEGPAATGKTETVKELAKFFGKLCIVFNCSSTMDSAGTTKFLKGMVATGAWICFDEFNRIRSDVLSVVGNQLVAIQRALNEGKSRVILNYDDIPLNPDCGIFVTKNPNYLGRSEIPDNVKALFRPIAMTVPDFEVIVQLLLYLSGFLSAKVLAKKIIAVISAAQNLVSRQRHYDFGMRAIKSVLDCAYHLKMKSNTVSEEILISRAILKSNVPKFTIGDAKRFNEIVATTFSSLKAATTVPRNLKEAIVWVCNEECYQLSNYCLKKIMQLKDTIQTRQSVIAIGPTLTGKSTCVSILSKALNRLGIKQQQNGKSSQVCVYVINPKALMQNQLYGCFDPVSQEWNDGVFSALFRDCYNRSRSRNAAGTEHWIYFDGPIDSSWIESLNSVLDDNRKLCLPSGEIIPFPRSMKLIFEASDLQFASPATVSRCGVTYFDTKQIAWRAIMHHHVRGIFGADSTHELTLANVAELLLHPVIKYVTDKCIILVKQLYYWIPVTSLHFARSIISQIEVKKDKIVKVVQNVMVYCVFKAACNLLGHFRQKGLMDLLVNVAETSEMSTHTAHQLGRIVPIISPQGQLTWTTSFHDVDQSNNGNTMGQIFAENAGYIHSAETYELTNDINNFVVAGIPVFLYGTTGSGKSRLISNYLMNLEGAKYTIIKLVFSAGSTVEWFQDVLFSQLERKSKETYCAPELTRAVVCIDDFGELKPDLLGVVPIYEFLTQLLEHGYIFDKRNGHKISIENVSFICASQLTDVLHNSGTFARVLNKFVILRIPNQSEDAMRLLMKKMSIQRMVSDTDVGFIEQVINASIKVQSRVSKNLNVSQPMLRCQYNIRHLKSILLAVASFAKPKTLRQFIVAFWIHEVFQVYESRLGSEEEIKQFRYIVRSVGLECFPESTVGLNHNEMRSDFYLYSNNPIYQHEEQSMEAVQSTLQNRVNSFNELPERNGNVLVLLHQAVPYILSLCRVLSLSSSHAILTGANGSGRKLCTQFAAYLKNCEVVVLDTTGSFCVDDWVVTLKKIMKRVVFDEIRVVYIIPQSQIIHYQSIMYYIGYIVNCGAIDDLYTLEDKMEIISNMQKKLPKPTGSLSYYSQQFYFETFASKVQEGLHIVTILSNLATVHVRWMKTLINCSNIIWFDKWNARTLTDFAKSILSESKFLKPDEIDRCVGACFDIFELTTLTATECKLQVQFNSSHFVEFVKLLRKLASKRYKSLVRSRNRYRFGVDRLQFAATQISEMQIELRLLKPELVVTSHETEKLMQKIETETSDIEYVKEVVASEESHANEAAAKAQMIKGECENELAEAIPALEAAMQALNTLKGTDISMLKTLKSPPNAIKMVMAAVCIMLDEKPVKVINPDTGKYVDDYWPISKKMLSDMRFTDRLRQFDKDHIPEHVIAKIRNGEYVGNPNFEPERVRKVSNAAEGICLWVRATEIYDRVLRVVRPKKARLNEAEKEMSYQMKILAIKRKELIDVTETLQALNDEFGLATQRKKDLGAQVVLCERKLERAERLISGLGGEKERWNDEANSLTTICDQFLGDIIVATAAVQFCGPFSLGIRERLVERWRNTVKTSTLYISSGTDVISSFGDPLLIKLWVTKGLSADKMSIENAVIISKSAKYSLIIDPQGEAKRWLMNISGERAFVVKMSSPTIDRSIENAVQLGLSLIIDGVQSFVHSMLLPIITKSIIYKGGLKKIKIGGEVITLHDNFKLFLITNALDAKLPVDLLNRLNLVNFILSPEGVEEQLLDIQVAVQAPNLQIRKQEIAIESVEHARQLKSLEENILEILSTNKQNILENEKAIQMLGTAKGVSDSIAKKQISTNKMKLKIEKLCEQYRSVAHYATIICFSVTDLSRLDPLYQFSLEWFTQLYKGVLMTCLQEDDKKEPGSLKKKMKVALIEDVYRNVSISLFGRHRQLFAFYLIIRILINRNDISDTDVLSLISGSYDPKIGVKGPLADLVWATANNMAQFQKEVERFLELFLNREYVYSKNISFFDCLKIFKNRDPIMIILSADSDPIEGLMEVGKLVGIPPANILNISFENEDVQAINKSVEKAIDEGCWMVLENCHLFEQSAFILEAVCDQLKTAVDVHVNFRLWITMYPSKTFSPTVLRLVAKMTTEPPANVKYILKKMYTSNIVRSIYGNDNQDIMMQHHVFHLAHFHAVVVARCGYGRFGWNQACSFNEMDFKIALTQLKEILGLKSDKSFVNAVQFLTGECNYGGKVSDVWDHRILIALIRKYYAKDETRFYDKQLTYGMALSRINKMSEVTQPTDVGLSMEILAATNLQRSKEFIAGLTLLFSRPTNTVLSGVTVQVASLVKTLKQRSTKLLPISTQSNLRARLVNTMLLEIDMYNATVSRLKSELFMLEKNSSRSSNISKVSDAIVEYLIRGELPPTWFDNLAHLATDIESFFKIMEKRYDFLNEWMVDGDPQSFQLNLLTCPDAFVTEVTRNYAQEQTIPLEMVKVHGIMTKPPANQIGAIIQSLRLEGAFYDAEEEILQATCNKQLSTTISKIYLRPHTIEDIGPGNYYECPVRSNGRCIFSLLLASDVDPDFWICRNVTAFIEYTN